MRKDIALVVWVWKMPNLKRIGWIDHSCRLTRKTISCLLVPRFLIPTRRTDPSFKPAVVRM